jgi:hypothetical protein
MCTPASPNQLNLDGGMSGMHSHNTINEPPMIAKRMGIVENK